MNTEKYTESEAISKCSFKRKKKIIPENKKIGIYERINNYNRRMCDG